MPHKPPALRSRKNTSSTLIKGLDAITLIAGNRNGLTLPEIVQALHEPRSNVLRLLKSLVLYGLAEQEGRIWRVTEGFHSWAVPDRHQFLRKRYRPVLEAIARETGELVLLGLHEGNGIIHLDYIEADQSVHVAPAPQTRHNLRINALGKLALSRRPDLWDDLDPALIAEFEEIRKSGVAWNRQESVSNMVAIAHKGFTNLPTEAMIAVAWPAERYSEQKAQLAIAEIKKAISGHQPRP